MNPVWVLVVVLPIVEKAILDDYRKKKERRESNLNDRMLGFGLLPQSLTVTVILPTGALVLVGVRKYGSKKRNGGARTTHDTRTPLEGGDRRMPKK